jgi:dipeptidyl aminopeptidase/acylaminoacyl peptidase
MLDPRSPARVDFSNPDRAPLLLIAGESDHAIPPSVVRRMYRAYQASPARTDLRTFPGRTHWIIAQDGWEEVAEACLAWIDPLRARWSPWQVDRRVPA